MEKAKIVFQNGMEIEAEENGSSLITDSRPDFPVDLSSVLVIGACGERIFKNAEIGVRFCRWPLLVCVPRNFGS